MNYEYLTDAQQVEIMNQELARLEREHFIQTNGFGPAAQPADLANLETKITDLKTKKKQIEDSKKPK